MFAAALTVPTVLSTLWTLPIYAAHAGFDNLRKQYAEAVNTGLVERSQLASGRFEQWVDCLEKLTLGPLARSR
jgi:hypothetical protein